MPTDSALPTDRAQVIAHRGACALRPEHTLEAYALAIADGADYIEPDLVCTRDGVLVARHESEIGGTTDVAQRPEFAARRATRVVDGTAVTGWFTDDFTLAELKSLRARERLPQVRSTDYDGRFCIPTFDEIVALVAAEAAARGRVIGLIPEVKQPSHFRRLGLPLEERLLERLDAHAYTRTAPVVIQSFETGNLRTLRTRLDGRPNVRLMQLLEKPGLSPFDSGIDGEPQHTFGEMMTPEGLRAIAQYAHLIGPRARSVVPVTDDGRLDAPTSLVDDAHAVGLQVMPYTYRPENFHLPRALWQGEDPRALSVAGAIADIHAALDAGVDGVFADHPAIAREAIGSWKLA